MLCCVFSAVCAANVSNRWVYFDFERIKWKARCKIRAVRCTILMEIDRREINVS